MRKHRWLLAGLTAALLAAAGCSSSSSSPSSASTTGASSAATGAGTAIEIGVICDCTGAFGPSIGAGAQVAQAWASSVNASGGISGHRVKLTVDDDQSNPSQSVSDAKALISQHVAAILDLSTLDSAWQKAVDAAQIPVIGGNLNSFQFYTDANWYPAGGTDDTTGPSIVAMAKQAGVSKIGILYCAEAPQCDQLVGPIKKDGAKVGIGAPYSAAISVTAPNYTAQCLAAKQAGVDGLWVSGAASEFGRVAGDCSKQGYNPVYLEVGTGFGPGLLSNSATKDDLWLSFGIMPFFTTGSQVEQMNTAVDKYYPGLRTNLNDWTGFAPQAWAAGELMGQAVTTAGVASASPVTAADMIKGLQALKGQTLNDWTPALTFTANQPHPVDCWYTARVQNGKASLANGGKTTCQTITS
jgi:branched-chain amino acid transport system substrate-binding protein